MPLRQTAMASALARAGASAEAWVVALAEASGAGLVEPLGLAWALRWASALVLGDGALDWPGWRSPPRHSSVS